MLGKKIIFTVAIITVKETRVPTFVLQKKINLLNCNIYIMSETGMMPH